MAKDKESTMLNIVTEKDNNVIANLNEAMNHDSIVNNVNVTVVTKSDDEVRLNFNKSADERLRIDIKRMIYAELQKNKLDNVLILKYSELENGRNEASSDIRKYKCHLCDKDYREKSNLNKHLLKHSSDVNFVCPTCNKSFTEKTNLNKHLVIHTGHRDYVCNICNLAYVRKSHLDRHFKVHLGDKNFNCTKCSKKFMYKANLKKHLRIHDRERTFLCEICNKKYKSNDILVNHMKIHMNIKNFVCVLCDKKFVQKIHLTEHMKNNHKSVKYDHSMVAPTIGSTRSNVRIKTVVSTMSEETELDQVEMESQL